MELNLVAIIHNNRTKYFAVNDKHYDGMLAGNLDEEEFGTWNYLGDVTISEEVLNEQGFYYKENDNGIENRDCKSN